MNKHKNEHSDLLHLFKGLKNMSIRSVEGSPNACELVFRCLAKQTEDISLKVALGDAEKIPQKVTFGSKEFIIEKIDSVGLVIAANGDVLKQLAGMKYLYCKGDSCYKVFHKYSFNGDVKTMLKLKNEGNITFDEWLKKKRIDPNNLEGTIMNFLSEDTLSDEVPDLLGKRINTQMYGDSLLLYMPVEAEREQTITSIVLPVRTSGNDVKAVINEQLCRELLGH